VRLPGLNIVGRHRDPVRFAPARQRAGAAARWRRARAGTGTDPV